MHNVFFFSFEYVRAPLNFFIFNEQIKMLY